MKRTMCLQDERVSALAPPDMQVAIMLCFAELLKTSIFLFTWRKIAAKVRLISAVPS